MAKRSKNPFGSKEEAQAWRARWRMFNEFETKDAVIRRCREIGARVGAPDPLMDAVIERIKPSIRLVPISKPIDEHEEGVVSQVGGQPRLPEGVSWPRFDEPKNFAEELAPSDLIGQPLAFIAQIDLAHVSVFDFCGLLPKKGTLQFFCLDWELSHGEVVCVLFHPDDVQLAQRDPPSDLPPAQRFNGVRVEPHLEWTIPSPYDLGIEKTAIERNDGELLALWNSVNEEVEALQGFGPRYAPKHRLLGHPELIQSLGLADGTTLLLQIDSDCVWPDKGYPETGMMWGDAGRLYFLMSDTDLKAANFDAVSGVLEMS